jgi:hypothetical protein
MGSFQMSLALGYNQPGRRAGLTRDYKVASLLQTINASANQNRNTMPPRAVIKSGTGGSKPEVLTKEFEEDLFRPPDSSDEEYDAGHIQPTDFRSASEKAEERREKDFVATASRKGTVTDDGNAAARMRSRRGKASSASSQSNSSPKRKSQEELKALGSGMVDEFGRVKVKTNKKQKTFRPKSYGKAAFQAAPILSSGLST